MRYDVDIHYIMPPEIFSEPEHAKRMKSVGIELNSRGNYMAKFRDPQTAEALDGASDEIKAYFKASGFAFIPSGGNLPAGTFDSRFDSHMTDVVNRLNSNLETANLPKGDQAKEAWNGFELGQFLMAVATGKPIDVNQRAASPTRSKATRRRWRTIFTLITFAAFCAMAWSVLTRT